MVYFEDVEEGGEQYLCVTADSSIKAEDDEHKFLIQPSMLRPEPDPALDPQMMRRKFPVAMNAPLNGALKGGPSYILKSCVKEFEEDSGHEKPFLLGRKIIEGHVRWGFNSMRVYGEAIHIPLYWEWTEDIIGRYQHRLKDAGIYDAVCASLYLYERDADVIRAFCECWCPSTNTLHTEVGEWSISLWDLHRLGGLPVRGRPYDETVPSYEVMTSLGEKGVKRLSRSCEYLFIAYCTLADANISSTGVSAVEWIQFWCKQENKYGPHPPGLPKRTKSTPSGDVAERPLDWNLKESNVFALLGVDDDTVRQTTYLAAFISCWLCTFVLPVDDKRFIRPSTFEVATRMAKGGEFSLAPTVLAHIYHGLTFMVNSKKPSRSQSFFPAHYLYGWLAHYFDTTKVLPDIPAGPLMVIRSGVRCGKHFSPTTARTMIQTCSNFKAASLVYTEKMCETVCDDMSLPALKMSYLISLRSAYLPLRRSSALVLEPYNPTRFSRQFSFCQDVPRMLKRRRRPISFQDALHSLRMLLFEGSRSRILLPGYIQKWRDLTTEGFELWWRDMTVTDLQENIQLLEASVDYKAAADDDDGAIKRAVEHCEEDSCAINFSTAHKSKKAKTGDMPKSTRRLTLKADQPRPASVKSMPKSTKVSEVLPPHGRSSLDTDVLVNSTLPPPPPRIVTKDVGFRRGMINTIKSQLLMQLKASPYEEVEHVVATDFSVCYETIQSLGGDLSSLKETVDAFVSHVREFLAARSEVNFDITQVDREVAEVAKNLESDQVILEEARQAAEHQEELVSYLAKKRADAQAILKALDDDVAKAKDRHAQQLRKISIIEPRVHTLQRQYESLQDSRIKQKDLDELERELIMMKENFMS